MFYNIAFFFIILRSDQKKYWNIIVPMKLLMKGVINMNKKVNTIITISIYFSIFIFSLSVCSCLSVKSYNKYIDEFETKIVKENSNVLSANILYDEGDWGEKKFYLLITFIDGQWILLSQVTEKQDKILIDGINGYSTFYYQRELDKQDNTLLDKRRYYRSYTYAVNTKFENINHICQNIDEISYLMNELEDIRDNKFDYKPIEWFWSTEANLKKL